jgi:CAAX protease family protein
MISGENHSDGQVVVREIGVFLIVGVLVWIVQQKEVQPLSSIGWHTDALLRSFLRGLGLAAIILVVTVGLYFLLQRAGVHLGEDHVNAFHPTLLVTTLIMLRAGVAEEIFYRGYAIERLQSLTGSKWVAGLVPLVLFAATHYRQGLGGIIAAFVLGGIFTAFYVKFRDLLANITAHFLADFFLNVILPLVTGG